MRLAGVGKRYGRGGRWVLRGVDLAVQSGEVVRIDGSNGSGKSTLLKLAAGIEHPTTGRVVRAARTAYVPERFPPALPFDARSYLVRVGRVHGLSEARAARRADDWLDRFGITDRAGTPLSRLSKGTCQKVAVAQALLAEADVLLLDEAWTGLDQEARALLDAAAAERAGTGGAVLFVDHDPHRLAGLSTAAYLLDGEGVLRRHAVPTGPSDGAGPVMVVEVDVPGGELPEWLPGAPRRAVLAGTVVRLEVPPAHSDALLRRLLSGRRPARVLSVRRHEVGPVGDDPATAGEPTGVEPPAAEDAEETV